MRKEFIVFLLAITAGGPGAALDLPKAPVDSDYEQHSSAEVALGQLLFYDKILSGNRNVACATCHHPRLGTSDGLSLGLGDGGIGLGPNVRRADPDNLPEQRIPRNSPALFNLGAREFTVLFHDGRIEADPTRPNGLRTPLGDEMSAGFASILSAQTMFPVLSADEMAGHYSENPIAQAVRQGRITGPDGAWDQISARVWALPEYRARFTALDPAIGRDRPLHFTDISDAVAAFMAVEWRSDDSPFDAYLRAEGGLPEDALAGMALFYGEAGCSTCHSGPFQSDHGFHAMGAPQIGPGKAARFETHARDEGRFRVTGRPEDLYRFRTPSLRNVALTGPYGHTGAHKDLDAFLRAHGVETVYDRGQAVLPALEGANDWRVFEDPIESAAIQSAAITLAPRSDAEIAQLEAFLNSLTGATALSGRLGVPEAVPSGLPVDQ